MAYLNTSSAHASAHARHDDRIETLICQLLKASPYSQNLDQVMDDLLAILGQQLQCDRVFLYLRSPRSTLGRVPFCWRSRPSVPLVYDPRWKPEPAALAKGDPMFAAALNAQPSIFVEDVETASPSILNRDFERATFGHRALVHAHLCSGQKLWGILQACVFDAPRAWNQGDRHLIDQAITWFTPLALQYVQVHHPDASPLRNDY